jgi:hypothetical protein
MNDEVAEFVSTLLHSGTVAHFMHWSTTSYSKHKALQKYYEGIVDLTDDFAESYMGRYKRLTQFPSDFHTAKEPIEYMEGIQSFVEEARESLPQDTELQNIIDDIADLINSTLYKLKNLE